jgi:Ala-tRNA(Pro) deacylase
VSSETVAEVPAPLLTLLERLGISVELARHPPVHTVEDARQHWLDLEGAHTKNLLLKDNKDQIWLVTMAADRRADMKALATVLGSGRLSFANADTLRATLGVAPGAVTPLALVNDTAHLVRFALDRSLAEAPRLTCHPLVNTATLSIATADLLRLLDELGVATAIIDLDAPPPTR